MSGKNSITYYASIVPDGSQFGVRVPDIPGCFSQGDNFEEAKAMAKEAIEGILYVYVRDGKPVPESRTEGPDLTPITVEVPIFHGRSKSA
jgi:predicted RNase H-like HicB family nuclease